MASKVGICNIGLRALGEPKIAALTDANPRARACAAAYDDVRQAVLRDHPWNSAVRLASLAVDATAPTWGYANRYLMPGSLLRILTMEVPTIVYEVQGRYIHTDSGAPLKIRYVADIDDPAQYDALLVQAMGFFLGWSIAEELTKSQRVKDKAWDGFVRMRSAATAVDAQEGTPPQFQANTFIDARR